LTPFRISVPFFCRLALNCCILLNQQLD
jgi:hypothetical protein